MNHPRPPRHRLERHLRVFLLSALTFFCVAAAGAQTPLSDSSKLKRVFGVGDDEFFKGAWIKVRPGTVGSDGAIWWEQAGQIWDLADTLGINILRVQAEDLNLHVTDSLLRQRTRTDQRLIVTHYGDTFALLSVGREIRFYPFTGLDSVEYKYWEAKFMTLAGGATVVSPSEVDVYDQPAKEQRYHRAAMSGPTVVARDIVFDQFPARIYRWPADSLAGSPGKLQNTDEFLADKLQFNRNATHQFVVVTGHLFDDSTSTAQPQDSILKVEVIYEIPKGQTYMEYHPAILDVIGDSILVPAWTWAHTDTIDIERNLATFLVRKSDLYPVGTIPNFDAYVEAALSFDARWCSDSADGLCNTGPLFPGNQSRRINLKLTWLGNEDVALRSVALRDSIGQLMLGASDTAGRASIFDAALREVRIGLSLDPAHPDSIRTGIIARAPHIESWPMHSAAFNVLTKFIADNIQVTDEINGGSDSIPVWDESNENHALFQRSNSAANPTLQVPLLALDADSIEHAYESTLQLSGFHQYVPYMLDHDMENYLHFEVGRSAAIARDLRRRLIIVPFCVAEMNINYNWDSSRPSRGVHSMVHIPEPAEMRTMVNLGLCYGARGVLWQVIDGQYNFMDPGQTATYASDPTHPYRYNSFADFGVHSPLVEGPNLDMFPEFHFTGSGGINGYGDTTSYATLTNFFTGWNIRSKALTDIHRWIDQVAPFLMKLDWRDGYSMHFIVKQPHDTTLEFRPLANEIVDSVWSRYPGSAVRDSLHRTFVELGLFYTKNTTGNPLKDTNHIFLVNRRCFERTEDVAKGSASGDSMDALAETRTIEVKLNMMHPIDTSEVFRSLRPVYIHPGSRTGARHGTAAIGDDLAARSRYDRPSRQRLLHHSWPRPRGSAQDHLRHAG